jgi:hypothetical protein
VITASKRSNELRGYLKGCQGYFAINLPYLAVLLYMLQVMTA